MSTVQVSYLRSSSGFLGGESASVRCPGGAANNLTSPAWALSPTTDDSRRHAALVDYHTNRFVVTSGCMMQMQATHSVCQGTLCRPVLPDNRTRLNCNLGPSTQYEVKFINKAAKTWREIGDLLLASLRNRCFRLCTNLPGCDAALLFAVSQPAARRFTRSAFPHLPGRTPRSRALFPCHTPGQSLTSHCRPVPSDHFR